MHLIIFARTPVAGHTKTRLIPLLGAAGAAAAAATLLEEQLTRVGEVSADKSLWVTSASPAMQGMAESHGCTLRQQRGRDLGERMANALHEAAPEDTARVLIGTDCPTLDAAYVQAAFAALDADPVVFGPAEDGGYGLIGCRGPVPYALFDGIAWSTQQVLEQSLAKTRALGIGTALLRPLWVTATE